MFSPKPNLLMVELIEKTLWVEKYRPASLDKIILSQDARDVVNKFVADDMIPNIFLCSKPGQGKTTLAKAFVNHFKADSLYINCSDENNVETVRTKVSDFSRTLSTNGRFKIVILDEADGFANIQAQKILRGLMEEVHELTRFIITANYKNKIIEALRSRCVEIDINPDVKSVGMRIVEILKAENVLFGPADYTPLRKLIERNFPDIRKIINEVQNSVFDGQLRIKECKLESEVSDEILKLVLEKNYLGVRQYLIDNENVFKHDYSLLLDDFYHRIIASPNIDPMIRAQWTIALAEYLWKSQNAIDQELNATACFFTLIKFLS